MKIIDPRQHPLSREHPRLYQLANQGLELLRGVPSNLIPAAGGNVWLHHTEYAGRAVHLAGHLDARSLTWPWRLLCASGRPALNVKRRYVSGIHMPWSQPHTMTT